MLSNLYITLSMPETRSMSDIVDEQACARGPADHNYIKRSEKPKQSTPLKLHPNISNKCGSCEKTFTGHSKKIRCGFCEQSYCCQCSRLTKNAFEVLAICESAAWYCSHCTHAVPGVQKVLIRLGNVEERCESLDKRVESLESKEYVSADKVKDLVHEEMSEAKEIESRRLNLICLNMPESKKPENSERQLEDQDFLKNLMKAKMNLDPELITVNKLVRLGKREIRTDGTYKCRPIRFTVEMFEHKRQILKANSLLRSCADEIFSNIYFTPDLTKNQRKQAFDLRSERRKREEKGERNLKISKGKIVVVTNSKKKHEHGLVGEGTASGRSSPTFFSA